MTKQKIIFQGAEAIITLNKNVITKNRIPKSYRIKELDDKIRKRRTKAETKLLLKASKIINTPLPIETTLSKGGRVISREKKGNPMTSEVRSRGGNSSTHQIKMPFIKGEKLSEYLNKFPLTKQKKVCKQIGESVAKLHNANIIHGDLTTSNMILVKELPTHLRSQINNSVNKKQLSKNLSLNKISAKNSAKGEFVATNRSSAPIIYFIDFGLGFISYKLEDKAVDLHLLKQALEAKHYQNWESLFKEVLKGYKKIKDFQKILERLKTIEKRGRYKG